MTYFRVLPRDLFNEANLLKCIGQLVMLIHDGKISNLVFEHDGDPFVIQQDSASGALYVENIQFFTKDPDPRFTGKLISFRRPLNARDPWPLETFEGDSVFDENGNFILNLEAYQHG